MVLAAACWCTAAAGEVPVKCGGMKGLAACPADAESLREGVSVVTCNSKCVQGLGSSHSEAPMRCLLCWPFCLRVQPQHKVAHSSVVLTASATSVFLLSTKLGTPGHLHQNKQSTAALVTREGPLAAMAPLLPKQRRLDCMCNSSA
jgi:hypothetical protein